MFTARRIHRPAIGWALACALLVSAMSGAAAAQAREVTQSAARAQEHYYSSYGEPQPIDVARSPALAQERYYSSYGAPEPLALPKSPSPSDDTPWLPIALSIAITLVIVTASATHLRRLPIRRRRAARVTT
jgi:hypothetical protein